MVFFNCLTYFVLVSSLVIASFENLLVGHKDALFLDQKAVEIGVEVDDSQEDSVVRERINHSVVDHKIPNQKDSVAPKNKKKRNFLWIIPALVGVGGLSYWFIKKLRKDPLDTGEFASEAEEASAFISRLESEYRDWYNNKSPKDFLPKTKAIQQKMELKHPDRSGLLVELRYDLLHLFVSIFEVGLDKDGLAPLAELINKNIANFETFFSDELNIEKLKRIKDELISSFTTNVGLCSFLDVLKRLGEDTSPLERVYAFLIFLRDDNANRTSLGFDNEF